MMIEITTLYILTPVWKTLTVIRDHSCKSNTSVPVFLQICPSNWMKFSMLPQPDGLLKSELDLFRTIDIQGREFVLRNFIRFTFNIGLRLDTCKPISLKLGMMLVMTKLDSVITSLNGLDTQSRSQDYVKARTCAFILLQICVKQTKCR